MALNIEILFEAVHESVLTQVGLSQRFWGAGEKDHLFLGSREKCQISRGRWKTNIYLLEAVSKYRVRTDLEKSLKMTLVLENSWNSKKVQFVLELSLSFEKNLLDNHKKSLKMIETVLLDAVRNKNQENCKIGNRKQSAVQYAMAFYSILFDSSSTN